MMKDGKRNVSGEGNGKERKWEREEKGKVKKMGDLLYLCKGYRKGCSSGVPRHRKRKKRIGCNQDHSIQQRKSKFLFLFIERRMGKGRERGKRKEERGKRKEERGKRKEERGKRKEERGKEGCQSKIEKENARGDSTQDQERDQRKQT
jgi:hypothetical protein